MELSSRQTLAALENRRLWNVILRIVTTNDAEPQAPSSDASDGIENGRLRLCGKRSGKSGPVLAACWSA